ncbi:hypothetical protein ACFE04_018507 [Oxalis oulophora]
MGKDPLSPNSSETKLETHSSKTRKVVEKSVYTVKIHATSSGKLKNEGPPSDFWSWRKYGQKPIKGSPYPSTKSTSDNDDGEAADSSKQEQLFHNMASPTTTTTICHHHLEPFFITGNDILLDGELCVSPNMMNFSREKTLDTEENDFFDELEELPIISSSNLQTNFFDERNITIPVFGPS